MTIHGVRQVTQAMAAQEKAIPQDVGVGVKRAGLYLQRESQLIVPVGPTGNLQNSAYTRAEGAGSDIEVEVGYTAMYALFVHEDRAAIHFTGQDKFLETPLRTKQAEMFAFIEKAAKVKT